MYRLFIFSGMQLVIPYQRVNPNACEDASVDIAAESGSQGLGLLFQFNISFSSIVLLDLHSLAGYILTRISALCRRPLICTLTVR